MKTCKKIIALVLSVLFITAGFAGCSSTDNEKYSSTKLIIGYNDATAPFLTVSKDGKVSGFEADLIKDIFDSVKGDLESYTFEKVDEGYALEEDGGFFDSQKDEYSAALLFGAVSKNNGTVNEDYSFTEPIITDRVIALVKKGSDIKTYADFAGKNAIVVGTTAKNAFDANTVIHDACKNVTYADDVAKDAKPIDYALTALDDGVADVVIVNELTFKPLKNNNYTTLDGELDTIDYVICCAKYSGWKDSINEAIREMKSKNFNDGDTFTPLVEKYFGYNASSFNYVSEGDE